MYMSSATSQNEFSNSDNRSSTLVKERPDRSLLEELPFPVSAETQELVTFGRGREWREVSILGQAPMIESPARVGDWLLVPARQDTSVIPAQTLARVQAVYAAGFRPKDWVIAHEAPMLLAAPAKPKTRLWEDVVKPKAEQAGKVLSQAGTAAWPVMWQVTKATAQITWAITKVVAVGSVITLGALLAAAASIDPILVAVMDDDTWIEIDRWWV